ncbi:hypothetical protein ES708_30619 [subsurface metagenome]
MKTQTVVKKYLPQNPDIEVLVPNYKEPILPVNHGGFGWYGLQAYNEQGQLMCHECGVFRDFLTRHIRKHGLSGRTYRIKYGLQMKAKLVSVSQSQKARIAVLRHPEIIERATMNIRNLVGRSKLKYPLQYQNMKDTCPGQLIRWLTEAALLYGPEISGAEADKYRSGLVGILKIRFGTFNKAKQIAKLIANDAHGKRMFSKQLILEDMCCFYSNHNRWPIYQNYRDGEMICHGGPVSRYGIKALRQEAMKLREEQEARAKLADRIPQIANNIELENAGYARR